MATGRVSIRVLRDLSVSIVPPVLHTHASVTDALYIYIYSWPLTAYSNNTFSKRVLSYCFETDMYSPL